MSTKVYAGLPKKSSHKQIHQIVAASTRSKTPLMFHGGPGLAKTSELEALISSWGNEVVTLTGATRDQSDFLGLASKVGESLKYLPFEYVKKLNSHKKGSTLVLDEINRSKIGAQNGMLRVIQEGYVGDTKLEEHVNIIAIGNLAEDSAGTTVMPDALANRMLHLRWNFGRETWLEGLVSGYENIIYPSMGELIGDLTFEERLNVKARVAQFLKYATAPGSAGSSTATGSLDSLISVEEPPSDPTVAGRAWSSPRSWHNAIRVMSEIGFGTPDAKSTSLLALEAAVGERGKSAFATWDAKNDLMDPMEALTDPSKINFKNLRPDVIFALLTSVAALGANDFNLFIPAQKLIARCAAANKPDLAMASARNLLNNVPDGGKIIPEMSTHFAPVMTTLGRWK